MELHEKKKAARNKKPTIGDVANLAGVAPSTVSHVINRTASISQETQEKVQAAIDKLNYSPNALARALRQSSTQLIGVVLQDISSEFYAHCAASILKAAREDNYVVLLCDASFNLENVKDGVNALIERRVDGLIFIGGHGDEDVIRSACEAGIPVVLGDRHFNDLPSVEFDNESTVRSLVCALYDSGYRRFAYAGEPISIQSNLEARFRGYQEGLRSCGLDANASTVILDESLHQLKLQESYLLFQKHFHAVPADKRPEVVLTSNDMIAHGFISAARRMGLSVPKDIAIIGFDDISISEFYVPSLTTIAQDANLLGRSCYQLFKNVIKGRKKKTHDILLQTIKVRESAVIPEDILKNYQ